MGLRTFAANKALGWIKEKFVNPNIEGIGTVKKILFENGKLLLTVELTGLEDRPIDITASDIRIAPDNSSIEVRMFESNMPFVQTALNRFATRAFDVPEGSARMGLATAKAVLGL